MDDNVSIKDSNNAAVPIASDAVGGAQYQRVKIAVGAEGAAADLAPGQALMAASLPVVIASNQTAVPIADGGNVITVDGTVTVQDGSGAITVDSPQLPVALGAGGGLKVDGSGTALPVSISGAVPVSDNSGSLTVDGDVTVTSPDTVITVTPTLDTNIYAAGDLLFDSTEVAAAVRANGGTAILQSVTIIDKGDQKAAFTLLIANAATDFGTLNSAPDPDDTEAATVIGWVPVVAADYVDLGGASVACLRNLGLLLKAGASTTSLYVAAMNGSGTPTYAASDLVLQIGLLRS